VLAKAVPSASGAESARCEQETEMTALNWKERVERKVWIRDKGVALELQCLVRTSRFTKDDNTLDRGLSLASTVADARSDHAVPAANCHLTLKGNAQF